MTGLFILIGCLLVFLHFINIFGPEKMEKSDRIQMAILMNACGFVLGLLVAAYLDTKHPSALDVYRGKTELQYNYKVVGNDTTITDSTVVFKQVKK